jgi:hypothetical protein
MINQERATISFDLIPHLSFKIGEAYRKVTKSDCQDIRLIRLYLGRVPGSSAKALQKASDTDPPIDLDQYRKLRDELGGEIEIPEAGEVCRAMGIMLGRVHWGAGVNGRDAELCLAGDEKGSVRLVIFDWNMVSRLDSRLDTSKRELMIKCQRWIIRQPLTSDAEVTDLPFGEYASETMVSGAKRLATLIANCESYYPRPRQTDIYPSFKQGYEQGVKDVLDEHAPSADSPQGVIERYDGVRGGYEEGLKSFFDEYEKQDREKLERWARRAKVTSA